MSSEILSSPNYSSLFETWVVEQCPDRKKILLLGVLAATTTANDMAILDEWIPRCDTILDQIAIEEIILQTLLFAGFPKTIEALKVLRKHFSQPAQKKHVDKHIAAGNTTSKIIYGKHHAKLVEVMDKLHPDLTRWMIEDGYGRVLSRPGLNLPDREIAVLASLMVSGMIHQFRAHIRGALLAGVRTDDIIWFTNTFQCIIDTNMSADFKKVTHQIVECFG